MRLTVLIPVYNTKHCHLIEAVESIQHQAENNLSHKVILIDDASSFEQTLLGFSYLKTRYQSLLSIERLPENMGTASALNYGHSFVNTEYVAIMGSDDISHPDRFRLQIEYLKKNPKTDVLGTNLFSFYDHDITRTPIFTSTHKEIPTGLGGDKRWLVNHGTVIYRQSAVMAVGGYDEKLRRAQDVDLWGRMKLKGFVFRNIPQVLYAWRRFKK